jgi:hypothetical protein
MNSNSYLKVTYDYTKHLTTLSTGSIVLIVTFAEKFAKDAYWRWLLPMSLCCLLGSLLCALACMFFTVGIEGASDESNVTDWEYNLAAKSLLAAIGLLFLGLFAIGLFGVLNL